MLGGGWRDQSIVLSERSGCSVGDTLEGRDGEQSQGARLCIPGPKKPFSDPGAEDVAS